MKSSIPTTRMFVHWGEGVGVDGGICCLLFVGCHVDTLICMKASWSQGHGRIPHQGEGHSSCCYNARSPALLEHSVLQPAARHLRPPISVTSLNKPTLEFEFFTVCTKLAEMAILYSKELTTARKSYLQWDSTWCKRLLLV